MTTPDHARRRGEASPGVDSDAWAGWAAETLRKGRCEACGAASIRLEGHHVLPQSKIKRVMGSVAITQLTDLRNHLAVCIRCHARHTSRLEPIPRSALSADAWVFAEELGLTWHVEKSYPDGA